jgi:hypothetical protein
MSWAGSVLLDLVVFINLSLGFIRAALEVTACHRNRGQDYKLHVSIACGTLVGVAQDRRVRSRGFFKSPAPVSDARPAFSPAH